MKNRIVNNFWIKIASLILAIIVWLHVNAELERQKWRQDKFYKPPTIGHTKDQPTQGNKGYIVEKK